MKFHPHARAGRSGRRTGLSGEVALLAPARTPAWAPAPAPALAPALAVTLALLLTVPALAQMPDAALPPPPGPAAQPVDPPQGVTPVDPDAAANVDAAQAPPVDASAGSELPGHRQVLEAIKSHPLVEKARAGLVEANPVPLAGEALKQASPRHVIQTAKENIDAHRFIATDLTEHDTPMAAIRQSLGTQSMGVKARVSLATSFHPVNIGLIVAAPLAMEATRQLASGNGFNVDGFKQALRPLPVAGTIGGLVAGDMVGVVASAALSKLGPVGMTAGFFVQPAMAWTGQLFGTNLGQNADKPDASVRSAMADTLRQIEPGRDAGQIVGGAIGTVVGQVLIPVPMLGSVVGGIVGGMIGAAAGNALAQVGPFKTINDKVKAWLHRKADAIDRGIPRPEDTHTNDPPRGPARTSPSPVPAPTPVVVVSPVPAPTPVPGTDLAGSRPRLPSPVPSSSLLAGRNDPSTDDVRIAAP